MRFLLVALLLTPVLALAQAPTDTLELAAVTVTAERVPLDPARAAAAVTVITDEEIQRRPVQNLADVLTLTPGFAFLNGDRAGTPPAAAVRGFYGGGEAEYVLLLVDGRPVNDIETGVVDWELVPLGGRRARRDPPRRGLVPLGRRGNRGRRQRGDGRGAGAAPGVRLGRERTERLFGHASGGGTVSGQTSARTARPKRYGGARDHAERVIGIVGGSGRTAPL